MLFCDDMPSAINPREPHFLPSESNLCLHSVVGFAEPFYPLLLI